MILWFQLLNYARAHNKPIIFVTDDVKSDWFLSAQESNGHPRPRPELLQEMFVEVSFLFHAYPGNEFIDQATEFLKLIPEPGISEDAKEVTEQNTAISALVVYAKKSMRGRIIDLYPGFHDEVNLKIFLTSTVVESIVNGQTVFKANFPSLEPGNYTLSSGIRYYARVTILAGQICEVDWR